MNMIPPNLCILIEQLEDARQFHDSAAAQSVRNLHTCHRSKAKAYAAMLAEIRAWESRNRVSAHDDGALHDDPRRFEPADTYAAMLERVFRMFEAATSSVRDSRICPADDAAEGKAKGGPGAQVRGRFDRPQLQAQACIVFVKDRSA